QPPVRKAPLHTLVWTRRAPARSSQGVPEQVRARCRWGCTKSGEELYYGAGNIECGGTVNQRKASGDVDDSCGENRLTRGFTSVYGWTRLGALAHVLGSHHHANPISLRKHHCPWFLE